MAQTGQRERSIPRTKLVCTIGPASSGRIDALVTAGMSVARVNLAHGEAADHETIVRAVRGAAERSGRDVAVLADLPGPKIRLGPLEDGEAWLEAGRAFRIGPGEAGGATGATATHPLAADLRPGDRVLLADGAVELRVTGATGDTLETLVELGGVVRSRAGIAVPVERLSLPALTPADREALPRLLAMGVDLVGLSFVRRASDVIALRDELERSGGEAHPAIVAKIETRPAVEDADAIVRAADAVMVARGDLGVELPYEDVPLLQRRLVRMALDVGRPVIVATQMLESMTAAPRPTRAEVSDVANAALDGVDAVMLSGETAIGAFPIEAALAATRILFAAEADPTFGTTSLGRLVADASVADDARAVALAAVEIARQDDDVASIACYTRTGRTGRLLAALRPPVPIVAFCPDVTVRRRLALSHGVRPRPIGAASGPAVERALIDAVSTLDVSADVAVVLVATTAGGGDGPNLVEVVRPSAPPSRSRRRAGC